MIRAVSALMFIRQDMARSKRVSRATDTSAATMLSAGQIQIELRKYSRMRYRSSQLINTPTRGGDSVALLELTYAEASSKLSVLTGAWSCKKGNEHASYPEACSN
jgi:hypothetical protein